MTSYANKQPSVLAQKSSFITFCVGHTRFALPVNAITYITSASAIETHNAPNQQKQMQAVFDFDGQPIELYRFNQIIGSSSQAMIVSELIQLLNDRQQDHIYWVDALEHSIVTGEPFAKATDPHKCAFGMWYDNYTPDDSELAEIMKRFDAPHKRIHSLAEKLLNLAKTQKGTHEAINILNDEKTSTLKELLRIFSLARSRLEDLLKPVIIIIQSQNHHFAIELDNIGGIKDFSTESWLPAVEEYGNALSCNDGFYQEANELYLKLCPIKIMNIINKKKNSKSLNY